MMAIIIFSLFFLCNSFAYADAVSISMGGTAPDFTLGSVEGKSVSLSEYKDKIVVLVYWKPGHKRSLLALEDANDIHGKYQRKGVEVIGLTAEADKKDEIIKLLEDKKISFPVLIDSDRNVYGDYGVRVYPSTVVINRDGKLVYDIPGHAVTYKVILEGYIRYLLKEVDEEELKNIISPGKEVKDKSLLEAERRYNLALKFADSNLVDQAIDAAERSLEARPDFMKSHLLLGFLFIEIKEADKAVDEFNKALELNPGSKDAQTGLGSAYNLKGDADKAIEFLTPAIRANPYPQKAYYQLGRAYELKDDKDSAVEMYRKALEKILKKHVLPSSISRCR